MVEFHDQTTLHPLGVFALLLLALAVLLLPRRHGALPFIMIACLLAPAQRVVIGGLDFSLLRILTLVGWSRVILRGEIQQRWNLADYLFFSWVLANSAAFVALHSSSAALVNRLGRIYDFIGLYVYFRCTVRSWDDVRGLIRSMTWLSLPVLAFFLLEWSTARNAFSMFGGVPEFTDMREGKLRCQGPFAHPILAGCFWAAWLPVIASGWWDTPKGRTRVLVACVATFVIVLSTASSTPLMGVAAAAMGGLAFYLRRQLRMIRLGTVVGLTALHLVMKAPVWHLIARIDVVGGSSGHHRFMLIDQTIRRFGEWWLMGVVSTYHWGYYMGDTANQYVAEAVTGGLLGLALFVATLAAAFRGVGRLTRARRRAGESEALAWGLGVSLFCHAVMFIGISISYSLQNVVGLVFVIAAVNGLSLAPERRGRAVHAAPAVRKRPSRLWMESAGSGQGS